MAARPNRLTGAGPAPVDTVASGCTVATMRLADLPDVIRLERICMPTPWPRFVWVGEILSASTCYVVARDASLAGFAGCRIADGVVHVTVLAVRPDHRRQGLGLALMNVLLHVGVLRGARTVVLQVRVANRAARSLYERMGFTDVSTLRGYYSDGADALLMELPITDHAESQ